MFLLNAIYFIPAFATLLWIVLLCFKRKTLTQQILLLMLFFCLYYYISYALYISPATDYLLMVQFDMLNLPVALAILALNIVFVQTHRSRKFIESKWHWFIYLPAVVYLVLSVLLYNLVGFDRVAYCEELNDRGEALPAEYLTSSYRLHSLVTDVLFNSIAFVGILITLFLCYRLSHKHGYVWGDAYRFFFRGAETSTVRAVSLMDAVTIGSMLPIALVGRMWMLHHPLFSAFMSLFTAAGLFCLCYVEFYLEMGHCTLFRLSHLEFLPTMTNYQSSIPAQRAMSADDSLDDLVVAGSSVNIPEGLPRQVRQAFEEEHIYRDAELNILTLADHLGTNRTTLSATINQCFGMPFRQFLNNYRVEAAKAYMMEHPKATQDAIAMECGFSSAQSFNLKFKAATGLAPRAWLLQNLLG